MQISPACTSPCGSRSSQSGWCQCLCPQSKALQDQHLGLTQAPFKLMFLPSPGAYEILCASFKSEVSIFHSLLGFPKVSPAGLRVKCPRGSHSPCRIPRLGYAQCRAQIFTLGRISAIVVIPPFVSFPLQTWVLDPWESASCSSHCGCLCL